MTLPSMTNIGIASRVVGVAAPLIAGPSILALSLSTEEASIVWGVLTAAVVVIVWLVRLEGRVNLAEQRHNDFARTIESRMDGLDGKLDRIDTKLDTLATRALVTRLHDARAEERE